MEQNSGERKDRIVQSKKTETKGSPLQNITLEKYEFMHREILLYPLNSGIILLSSMKAKVSLCCENIIWYSGFLK